MDSLALLLFASIPLYIITDGFLPLGWLFALIDWLATRERS